MALAGSISCNIHRYLDLDFIWVAAQDPAARGSRIYWHTLLRAGDYGRIEAIPGSAWSTVIDGQVFSGKTDISVAANSAKELASGEVFLKHDGFGEKSFDFSFSQVLNITYEGVYTGQVTGSGSGILDALDPDVAPVLDKPQVYLGEVLRISPRGPLGASYRLRYAMGGAEGVIAEDVTGFVDWVVPVELGGQIPYTDKGILRILCDTFRDGVPVGRAREAALVALVPDSAVPAVEEFSWQDDSGAAALGLLLQHVSRLTGQAACVGAMGSRVTRCDMSVGGKPLGLLTEAGQQEILVTVTDSRGRVGQLRQDIFVVPYEAPRVTIGAHRCLADGSADDTGGWANISLALGWTCLGQGNARAWVKKGQEDVLSQALAEAEAGKAVGQRVETVLETVVPAAEALAHAMGGFLFDGLMTAEHWMALSTAYCILDVLYGGKGIAFGTVAREPGFLCAMDAKFTGKVILPDGTDLMERLGGAVS